MLIPALYERVQAPTIGMQALGSSEQRTTGILRDRCAGDSTVYACMAARGTYEQPSARKRLAESGCSLIILTIAG